MLPLTDSLSLLRAALNLYWFPALDVYVFRNMVTVIGEGLFVFNADLDKNFSYPFVGTNIEDLSAFLCGKLPMTFSNAAGREHVQPHDWLSANGFDVCSRDIGTVLGRTPAAVFAHTRVARGVGVLIEENGQRLGVLMSECVLAVAQSAS